MEVYPALALPALKPVIMTRGRGARYNPKKNFSLSDWKLVASTVRRHANALHLAPLSRWADEMARLAAPTKRDQDRLDAAVCLLIVLYWRRAPRDRSAVIGDSRTGYMVTPVSRESREILERAAGEKNVLFDLPWPQDVDRSPHGAPGTGCRRESPSRPVTRGQATSSESGAAEYRCPIPDCSKIFLGSRGGWNAHVGSPGMHPDWRPDVSDPGERKRIFKHEHNDWLKQRPYGNGA